MTGPTTRHERPTNGRPWPGTRVTFPATGATGTVEHYEWWWDSTTFPVRMDAPGRPTRMASHLSATWNTRIIPLPAAAEHNPRTPSRHASPPRTQGVA